MATVVFTPEAREQLARLSRPIRNRVVKSAGRLEAWPDVSGFKPLSGNLSGKYRMRVGDYRLRFYVKGDTITVDKVGHRRDFYDD